MRNHKRLAAAAALLCLAALINPINARQLPSKKPPSDTTAAPAKPSGKMSPEEEIVRAAYEKLTMLSRAARFLNDPTSSQPWEEAHVLKFELSNFQTGPIQEIWGALHSRVKTDGYSGDIIRLTHSTTRHNKGEEHVAYRAQWGSGQYASIYDRQWTVGDLLSYEPNKYYDVGEYATYDVTVSFEGKTRAYRALALFHNPYRSTENLKPEFWDSIIGQGGTLTEAWNEKRPPAEPWKDLPGGKGKRAGPLDVSPLRQSREQSFAEVGGISASSVSESYSMASASSDVFSNTTQDTTEHTSGAHGETVGFQGSCSERSGNEQGCLVKPVFTFDFDNGRLSNLLYSHVFHTKDAEESAFGPRGMPITCSAARGIAVSNCLSNNCAFSVSLSLNGGAPR